MTYEEADRAFEKSVPEHRRCEILEQIVEAAQGCGDHKDITILERDRQDAINVRVVGYINIDGHEHRFIVSDGNWNGTMIEDWDGDMGFEALPRTKWVLQPTQQIIYRATSPPKARNLLAMWDGFLKRPDIASLASNYSYDRYVQPGEAIERHYRAKADRVGLVLVDEEQSKETRLRLERIANSDAVSGNYRNTERV